jgi:uncharacterized RDD family membrane protein YckC
MKNQFTVSKDLIASQGKRFLNYIIDIIVIYISILILTIIVGIIQSILGNESYLIWLENISDLEGYLVFFSVMIPYFILMEKFTSRTIGKFITGTIVVDKNGETPNLETILKRTFCRIIPFDGLSYLGSPSRGWHDSMSDTYVVNKKDFEIKKELFYSFDEIGEKINE